jgi:phosphate transport system ATP-binding protein
MDAGHRIAIFDLDAYYGAAEALKGVTIEFPAHQISAIIGPSGCGTSTLLRCINRMHEEIPRRARHGKGHCSTTTTYMHQMSGSPQCGS